MSNLRQQVVVAYGLKLEVAMLSKSQPCRCNRMCSYYQHERIILLPILLSFKLHWSLVARSSADKRCTGLPVSLNGMPARSGITRQDMQDHTSPSLLHLLFHKALLCPCYSPRNKQSTVFNFMDMSGNIIILVSHHWAFSAPADFFFSRDGQNWMQYSRLWHMGIFTE